MGNLWDPRAWAVEADESRMVIRCRDGGERSRKLTFWLRSGLSGDVSGHGVDVESAEDEGDDNCFGKHDDREYREEEQITTAPGPKFWRSERRTGVSCTAAEETRGRTSTLL